MPVYAGSEEDMALACRDVPRFRGLRRLAGRMFVLPLRVSGVGN
jgi:hypothetical protein